MHAVGIRELKAKLSQYIRLVEAGESVLVTDRGTVVAELRPPGPAAHVLHPSGLAELERRGAASTGAPHDPSLYAPRPRVLPADRLRELLDAERGDV